ncbi:dienelactone hydrolase family protein [Pseudomonas sp. MMS21-TM103]|uniref:dienelactone hydrolase family protein n=1 Tax=Pseudomonas sp. MMS21 TM103 TaxID=2886506 RepID=UPI001EDE88D0|nr:dienelactone hydrolase family protein [Pseudomonas sp. MMS21 TM103]MCG4455930.1 dienelactone hydrolase family protein [Pseudomonas sp. MMS21 TM103]
MQTPASRTLKLTVGDAELDADLLLPDDPIGLVVFAHGSGSSRLSPRNLQVAHYFNDLGLATLLFDLLTGQEERVDRLSAEYRFDIPRLSQRLVGVLDWLAGNAELGALHIGLFGASTGAAAALIAAAQRPQVVHAVVSRGGRCDLAGPSLPKVRAPTLQIVGGRDPQVVQLNREASQQLQCEQQLAVVPGATHLFEEPDALEQVAMLAGDWFCRHLRANNS